MVYRNRRLLPFSPVILVTGVLLLTVGFTHVLLATIPFLPAYGLTVYVRALTAIVSVAAASMAFPLIPKVQQGLRTSLEVREKEHQLRHKEEQLQRSIHVNETLLEIVQLAREDNAVHTAEQVLLRFREALNVDWLGLGIQEGDTIHLSGVWHSEQATGILTQTELPPVMRGVGMAWLAIEAQGAVYIEDYAADPRATPLYLQERLSSVALIPLTDPGAGNTIVMIASKVGENRGWASWERQLFDAARVSVSIAMERQEHLQDMETAALQDFLTGLGNRRAFEDALRTERARAHRHHQPFGLMMLDLDGLKQLNDRLGHEAGDHLLQTFGERLQHGMRAEDHCYRLGGDEFAVLLSNTPMASAETLHCRIRKLVGEMHAEFSEVDVSVGLAFYPDEHTDAPNLIRLADERMYAMKAQHHSETTGRS